MKIGIFDSGLGGLIVAKSIRQKMPEYDYVYLGDTKRVPYGNRSKETVLQFARECIDYLFEKEKCGMVIVACNTVSAQALKELQQEFAPKKVLGVLIPAAEEAAIFNRIGVIATIGTVASNSFPIEIKKRNRRAKIFQNAAPMLVPLAEAGEHKRVAQFIEEYLKPFHKNQIQALVLGCTHYPIFKREIKKYLGRKIKIVSQDEIVPKKLKKYLSAHPEIKLSSRGTVKILVTDETHTIDILARKWFGNVKPKLISV